MSAKKLNFERIGKCLYRRGLTIYVRVWINKRQTWRSTETNDPAAARAWLKKWHTEGWMLANGIEPKGVVLRRQRTTVGELLDEYVKAGCPTRKMQAKAGSTLKNEIYFLGPVREYFAGIPAATLTLADCDKYRDWRASGGYVAKFNLRGKPQTMATSGGNRCVDLELGVLANALSLGVRRNKLSSDPLAGRSRYTSSSEIRHCREVAPTPQNLKKIEEWFRTREEDLLADLICFLAYSGLRVGEAVPLRWSAVNWGEEILDVKRQKRGVTPWVPILPEMSGLLKAMKTRATGPLLFSSPFNQNVPRDVSAFRHRLTKACQKLNIGHVTPHGLRSYFVTQARQSGLTDADIAMLIGDKTGPAIIAQTYGDVRPDHLIAQAQRIRLTASGGLGAGDQSSNNSSNTMHDVSVRYGSSRKIGKSMKLPARVALQLTS